MVIIIPLFWFLTYLWQGVLVGTISISNAFFSVFLICAVSLGSFSGYYAFQQRSKQSLLWCNLTYTANGDAFFGDRLPLDGLPTIIDIKSYGTFSNQAFKKFLEEGYRYLIHFRFRTDSYWLSDMFLLSINNTLEGLPETYWDWLLWCALPIKAWQFNLSVTERTLPPLGYPIVQLTNS